MARAGDGVEVAARRPTADDRASATGDGTLPDPALLARLADPYREYARLRAVAPIQPTALGWTLLSYADCEAVLRDPRWGRAAGHDREWGRAPDDDVAPAEGDAAQQRSFLRLNPPEHTRLRGLVAKAFTPKVVAGMRPAIQRITDDLIDRMLVKGDVDLVADLNYPLPVSVICTLLGVPIEDQPAFARWTPALARGLDPVYTLTADEKRERVAAVMWLRRYFAELVAKRYRTSGDDLLTRLIAVEQAGDQLSRGELLATCVLLLMAGHETTVNLMGNAVLALLRNPDQLALLRDGRVPADSSWVDEVMRYDGPVQLMSRTALADVDLAGRTWNKGTNVIVMVGAANHDPEVFADPHRLDLTRVKVRHLGFGMGIHFCLGAALAHLETDTAIRTLLRRAPRLSLRIDQPEYKDNVVLRGLRSLPVRLTC